MGLDIRYVVTNLKTGSADWLDDTLYCERGQAENLIKLHKNQLASNRISCRSPLANQFHLILHIAAYWLMLTVRDVIPQAEKLAGSAFTTLRLRLIKTCPRAGGNRRTHHRDRHPRTDRFRHSLPRSRVVPAHRPRRADRWALTDGACVPEPPHITPTPTPQNRHKCRNETGAVKSRAHHPAAINKTSHRE